MVCNRCIMVVQNELEKLYLSVISIKLGEVVFEREPTAEEKKNLADALFVLGFQVKKKKKSRIIEKIKNFIIDLVHHHQNDSKSNLSDVLSNELNHDYNYLSNLFSEIEGTTIEKYFIAQKIERVKELLSLMESDSYEFYQQITSTFYNYSILNSLEPIDFLNQLLKIDYRSVICAIDGLNSRYTVHSESKIYLQEEEWFEKLIDLANKNLTQSTSLLERHKIQDKFLSRLIEIKEQAYKG